MNIWDILILLLVAAVVLWGARRIRKGKSGCCSGSCADCSGCSGCAQCAGKKGSDEGRA